MSVRQVLGRMRAGVVQALDRRELPLGERGPIVSFTFDDFPRSALAVGGAILKSHGVRGTFYAAAGLMGQVDALGRQYREEDLYELLRDGHELGSHTFGHVSCRRLPLERFEADVIKGKEAVERVAGHGKPHHFAYPYGHATLRAKGRVGALVSSCRGVIPGVNESPVDLNLLRANALYSGSRALAAVDHLLRENEERKGWLIFYTHDVAEAPSAFGCRPGEFERVVKLAVSSRAAVLPVGEAAGCPASAAHLTAGPSGGVPEFGLPGDPEALEAAPSVEIGPS